MKKGFFRVVLCFAVMLLLVACDSNIDNLNAEQKQLVEDIKPALIKLADCADDKLSLEDELNDGARVIVNFDKTSVLETLLADQVRQGTISVEDIKNYNDTNNLKYRIELVIVNQAALENELVLSVFAFNDNDAANEFYRMFFPRNNFASVSVIKKEIIAVSGTLEHDKTELLAVLGDMLNQIS